jgi:hypothetical protein
MSARLINCPVCGQQVSSEAERCPTCAQPIKRGFMGRAGGERALNVTCLVIVVVGVALFLMFSCMAALTR